MAGEPFGGAYRGRRVLVTGHTGFKGAWLCEWLHSLGAQVTGYSLPAPTHPALSTQLGLSGQIESIEGDIRDGARLADVISSVEPEYVFHLAAQAIVRESYVRPVETFAVNILGTANLLEGLRPLRRPCAAVVVTSDKCYENRQWVYGYREEDPMGGHDPYSASKGATELIVASMRRSFFTGHPVQVATARAGNVIGGGDWAGDRIVPDCMRALQAGESIRVRNRRATRPWQHVLEPLSGYLWLGACLREPARARAPIEVLASGWNFGPGRDGNRTVGDLVTEVVRHWPGRWEEASEAGAPHEARWLQLCVDKAEALLGWRPTWVFADGVRETVAWYRRARELKAPEEVRLLTRSQIDLHTLCAREMGMEWAWASDGPQA